MIIYFNIFGKNIPAYGVMIILGVLFANVLGYRLIKKYDFNIYDFIILEAYGFLGGFSGAKILYLIVSYRDIEWKRITDIIYFNQIMQGGFVFYGGLIGGVLLIMLAGKMHKIPAMDYIRTFICFIPFIHAFGRIGCFCSGCCYGKPYNGYGAVVFPKGSYAIPDVPLFPVQLVEAVVLFVIFGILYYIRCIKEEKCIIEVYFLLYGVTRFVLEYYRYDEARGKYAFFSTSQWISIAMIIIAGMLLLLSYSKSKKEIRY